MRASYGLDPAVLANIDLDDHASRNELLTHVITALGLGKLTATAGTAIIAGIRNAENAMAGKWEKLALQLADRVKELEQRLGDRR